MCFSPHVVPVRTGEASASGKQGGVWQTAGSVLCPQGDQFVFYEDWGETMVSKSTPVLCVLDVESGNISVLEGVPEKVSPGQVSTDSPPHSRSLGTLPEPLPVRSHLPWGLACRHSGLPETRGWFSLAGGTSPSGWAFVSVPIGGEQAGQGRQGRGPCSSGWS